MVDEQRRFGSLLAATRPGSRNLVLFISFRGETTHNDYEGETELARFSLFTNFSFSLTAPQRKSWQRSKADRDKKETIPRHL